jgi:hypothetical protein
MGELQAIVHPLRTVSHNKYSRARWLAAVAWATAVIVALPNAVTHEYGDLPNGKQFCHVRIAPSLFWGGQTDRVPLAHLVGQLRHIQLGVARKRAVFHNGRLVDAVVVGGDRVRARVLPRVDTIDTVEKCHSVSGCV